VDLLLALVHKISARAEDRVERAMIADLKRVRAILFALAEAAVKFPDETVRRAIYPVVGEQTLRELVLEGRADEETFRAEVRRVLRASYSNHYRRMLPRVLGALEFRCNNTAYRPVIDALGLLRRYAERVKFYDPTERVPLDGVVRPGWRDAVLDERGRVERIPYELYVLSSLRDAIRGSPAPRTAPPPPRSHGVVFVDVAGLRHILCRRLAVAADAAFALIEQPAALPDAGADGPARGLRHQLLQHGRHHDELTTTIAWATRGRPRNAGPLGSGDAPHTDRHRAQRPR
jgi:hypothetical protein